MADRDRRERSEAGDGPAGRLYAARWTLVAAAAGLLALVAFAGAPAPGALAAFAAVVAAAAALPVGRKRVLSLETAAASAAQGEDVRLARLVAALPEPAILVDRRSVIVAANARVEAAVGSARLQEPLLFTLRVPEVLEAVRAVAAGAPARRVEFQARTPVDRWFEAHVAPVNYRDAEPAAGQPDVTLVMLRDLTQQRRLEQMRADFVANASHELRTPLASLSGFIETLQGPARNDTPARERFLVIMAEQARRMSRLIDDLLSLSRIELNLHVQPETVVDLVPIVREVVDALAPLARERAVEVRVAMRAASLPVRGDRDELIRVVENLVENALKYGVSDKGIDIVCETTGADGEAEAVVRVTDYGAGIPAEHLPRLTERFYRVDIAHSREQGGTGLGLAIVKHILNRHRGRLEIDSDLGRGADFAFHLRREDGSDV